VSSIHKEHNASTRIKTAQIKRQRSQTGASQDPYQSSESFFLVNYQC
jgi:hypothetical protein